MNYGRYAGVFPALWPSLLVAIACQKVAQPSGALNQDSPRFEGSGQSAPSGATAGLSGFSLSETNSSSKADTSPAEDPTSSAPSSGDATAAGSPPPPALPNAAALGGALRELPGSGGATPLVLDWNRDGVVRTAVATGYPHVAFDLYGRGEKSLVAWIGPTDALLGLDINGNGQIDNGTELFGDGTRIGNAGFNAAHGFIALGQHDTDRNGLIDQSDPVFSRLLIWQDTNHNGISEKGELTPLAATDVVAVDLRYTHVPTSLGMMDSSSSFIGQRSRYKTRSGESFEIVDVYFSLRKNNLAYVMSPLGTGPSAQGGGR